MTLKDIALKLQTFLDNTFPDQIFSVTSQFGSDTYTVLWELGTFSSATKNLVHYKVLGELVNPKSPIYGVRDDRVIYRPAPTVAREEFVRTIIEEDPEHKDVYFNLDPRLKPIGFYKKSTDKTDAGASAVYHHLLYNYDFSFYMPHQYSDDLDSENKINPPESTGGPICIYMQPLGNVSIELSDTSDTALTAKYSFMELESAIANTYFKAPEIDELSKTNFNKLLAEFIIRQHQVNTLNKIYYQ